MGKDVLTDEQYVYHIQPRTLTETISCFTGIPGEKLKNANLKNLERINIALAFMALSPKFDRTATGRELCPPADVTIESLGQFEDLRALIQKMPKKPMEEYLPEDDHTGAG